MRTLGNNMAFLIKSIAMGKEMFWSAGAGRTYRDELHSVDLYDDFRG